MDYKAAYTPEHVLDMRFDAAAPPLRHDQRPVTEMRRPRSEESLAEADAKRTGQATLDMIRQTVQVIRIAEDRGQALADRGHQIAQRAIEELKAAQTRIKILEDQLRAAEARAKDAEEWLGRVHDAMRRNLVDRENMSRSLSAVSAA